MTERDEVDELRIRAGLTKHEVELKRVQIAAAALLSRALHGAALTQRGLAKRMGTTDSGVSRLLSGSENMTLATLVKFLYAYDPGYKLVLDVTGGPEETCPECRELKPLITFDGGLCRLCRAREAK